MHRHQCDNCGFIWEHGDENGGNQQAHTCLVCGSEQYLKLTTNAQLTQEDFAAFLVADAVRRTRN